MSLTKLNVVRVLILLAVAVIVTASEHDITRKKIDLKSNTVVGTTSGKIKGSILKTWSNQDFLAFRGIPFAQPPVGKLRFKAPVSVTPWQGVKDATQDGKICPQFNMNIGSVDEDCLNLNVYTKNVKGSQPVIIFFHPGAFYSMTAASYWTGPQYLMDQNIVLVTANYRLDALGYLSTGDETVLGNNGMKDQVEALRWIQKHIKNFGGNPNKVTIAGYSAGSTSGFLHMLSPMSRGLFHGVIAMSGGVTSDWVIAKDPLKYAKSLASLFNCSTDSNEKMIDCLRKVPATEINSKFNELRTFAGIPMVVFGPVIEKDFGTGEERFLTDDPVSLIKKKQFHHVPVVTGVTENEFISWSSYVLNNNTLSFELINNFDRLAPTLFGYSDKSPNEAQTITNEFRKFYFGDKSITKDSVSELGKLYSDYSIIYGQYITTKLLVYYNEKSVYSYLLTYKGRYSHAVDPNTNKTLGPAHHDDLIYLFYISRIFPEFNQTDPEAFMVKTETSFWKNFASNGDPTPDGSPVQWTPVTRANKNYLNIGSTLKMENRNQSPYVARMKLWEKLFPVK